MKCRYCGYQIPDGEMYCRRCGKEVRIVPDYNPLDDMLTEQIKVSINGKEAYDDFYDDSLVRNKRARRPQNRQTENRRRTAAGRNTRQGNPGQSSSRDRMTERDRRRRQAERKRARRRRRRRRLLLMLLFLLALAVAAVYFLYRGSYKGLVNRGNSALAEQNYTEAETLFNKAISKNKEKPEAYTGLADVYIAQDNEDKAEAVFRTAIDTQKDNADLYEACVQFYMDTEQQAEIPYLLKDAEDNVREALGGYIVDAPEFSLDEEETFEDVQTLTLTAQDGFAIYYTEDGSDPTVDSTEYDGAIQISEGTTTITAIAVNKKGVPSLPDAKTYTVELPIEDAPAVSPSTGQYEEATKIEIKVPDGYEAYYTMDKSDPTTASTKYTGPIDMPEGTTIFKAILVNSKGRTSGITTRNYELVLE